MSEPEIALQEAVPDDEAKHELMDTLSKGNFTMRILYEQLANVQKMGSVGQIMSMIPGLSNSGIFDKVLHLLRLTSYFIESTQKAVLLSSELNAMNGRAPGMGKGLQAHHHHMTASSLRQLSGEPCMQRNEENLLR